MTAPEPGRDETPPRLASDAHGDEREADGTEHEEGE